MINEENLNKLYNGIIENNTLTTKQLKEYGLNSKDLKKLIEKGKINRVKIGIYNIISVDELFFYGKKLLKNKEYEQATKCFEKCFEIDKTHKGTCFQLFLRSIQNENYEKAFELYDILAQTKNEFYNIDLNYYLYLLNIITKIPEKYKEYVKHLKFEDIKVLYEDKRYNDKKTENKIRYEIMQKKLAYAMKLLNKICNEQITLQNKIEKILLTQAIAKEKINKDIINHWIKENDYNNIINYLSNKKEKINLSLSEKYILKLINIHIKIQEKKSIPEKIDLKIENIFDAIDTNNFEEALKQSEKFNKKRNIPNEENGIYLLLNKICTTINELSNIEKNEPTSEINKQKKEQEKTNTKEIVVTFTTIITYLMQNNIDKAFDNLKKYLESINKTDYETLIINLIKISLLEKDIAFTKPMLTLALINKGTYKFDVSKYIQEFYINISKNKYEEAKIYLDIISKSKKEEQYIPVENLYQILETLEKNNKIPNTNTQPKEKKLIIEKEIIEENKEQEEDNAKEKKFVAKEYEKLLKNQDIILLKPMENTRIEKILKEVQKYDDITTFTIGEKEKQIVLKYKNKTQEPLDTKKLFEEGNEAYRNGKYNDCITIYKKLLEYFDTPNEFVYSKLGLAYMKIWNIKLAIKYLTIVTELSKQGTKKFDFTELILSLKGEISPIDKKPKFKEQENNFNYNDMND